jgi:carboxylesterase
LIHGFTGSPWEMRPLGERLGQEGFHALGLCLPGHGTTPEAMRHVRSRDWILASARALLGFSQPVHVLGLSMGALLSVWLAGRFPRRVRSLVLMAPAVRFQGLQMALAKALSPFHWFERLKPWVHKSSVDLADPEARANAPILTRFPSGRLRDLFKVQAASRAQWRKVRAPTLVAVSRDDHVVDQHGAWALAEGLKLAQVERLVVDRGAHLMPRDLGHEELFLHVVDFLRRH